ncbi:MAG: hypothetical protein CL472_01010 [Acidobacteria bacterium]|nr:hypothetical protein [Acidobacteriota bacterium]
MSKMNMNPEQKAAVEHRDGPCTLVAGPGSGKTAVLTNRAAKLVASGVPPQRILLLTFMRSAAAEMTQRAKAIEPACENIDAGTFHSVAMRIVNTNAHVFGRDRKFTVIDPQDTTSIIKKIVAQLRKDQKNWPIPSTIKSVLSYQANTRSSLEEALMIKAPQHMDSLSDIEAVRDAYADYKLSRGLIDYDDVLEYLSILLADPHIGPQIRSAWDYVMVDEYQDVNALQIDLVYNLASETRNIMIVGDPSQSIFAFRGSAPATMSAFRDQYPDGKVIQLSSNYRSTPEIVGLVNAIDERIDTGFERELIAARPASDAKPVILEMDSPQIQAKAIAEAILKLKHDQGVAISDNAVLVRSMNVARLIEAEFLARRIPYKVSGGLKIDAAAHIKDLLSIIRIVTNPLHEPAWIRVLERYPGVAAVKAGRIAERLCATGDVSASIELLRDPEFNDLFDDLANALETAIAHSFKPADGIDAVCKIMNDRWSQIKEWRDDWELRKRDFEAIGIIAEQYGDYENFLTAVTLDRSLDQKKDHNPDPNQDEDPVTISTIHSAKGLEWDHVHIPSFNRGHIPSAYDDNVEEELRLFYVAASRARLNLTFYKPRFDAKRNFTAQSMFEPVIQHLVRRGRIAPRAADGGPVSATGTIDLRSRLAANRK